MRQNLTTFTLVLSLLAAPAALPVGLGAPEGRVILTVTGAAEAAGDDGAVSFDLPMLEGIAGRETTTQTPWYDEVHTFTGPLLSEVVAAVGAEGRDLRVQALNGYEAIIPAADIATLPIILATRIDGEALSVRDKGPVFVVYPFDLGPQLYNETYFSRSVWQVVAMHAL